MYVYIFLLTVGSISHVNSECSASSDRTAEARLREKLFCNYNKTVRPVKNFSNETNVQFQLWPQRIYMDHYYEIISVHGNILYTWRDVFLTWDPREYEGIMFLRVSSDEIWVPDITIDSPSEYMQNWFRMSAIDCHVVPSGQVYCFPMSTLQSYCSPDMRKYPYDTQNCSIIFSSFGFMGTHLNFSLAEPDRGIVMTSYRPNKVWELVEHTTERIVKYFSFDNSTFYPYIRCTFILRRHAAADQALLVIPAVGLAFSTLLTFLMGSMYNNRIIVSAVAIISDVVYLIYLGIMLPANGDEPIIIITFFRDSFVIAIYSLLITVLARSLTQDSTSPQDWITGFISKVESTPVVNFILLTDNSPKEEDTVSIVDANPKEKLTPWHQLATLIDRCSLIICTLSFVILTCVYLP